MDSNGHLSPPRSLTASVPIAQISPTFEHLEEHSIRAVATLVWPYSSATKSLALLLAEPDVRRRRSNGQVKVIFHGLVAESVAKAQAGIGDEVALSLSGSRLADAKTTGNCVPWDVHFDDRVSLQVYGAELWYDRLLISSQVFRSEKLLSTINVAPPAGPPRTTEETAAAPSTPQTVGARLGGPTLTDALGSWESPAFTQRSRTSFGGLLDTPYDPFAEEDGFVPGKGRKRPRFSMQSSQWRVIDEPESPGEKEAPVDWMEILDGEISEPEVEEKGAGDLNATEAAEAGPPTQDAERPMDFAKPQNDITPSITQSHPDPDGPDQEQPVADAARHLLALDNKANAREAFNHFLHLPTDTPRLHPVPSPGLPVPSPLVPSNNSNGYFSSCTSTTQVPHGPFATSETQATMARVDGNAGFQIPPVQPQMQATSPLTFETRSHESPLREPGLETQDLGIYIQESEQTAVDENTEPFWQTNAQFNEEKEPDPGDYEANQPESMAIAALQRQEQTDDVDEYADESAVNESKEGSEDGDDEYAEGDEGLSAEDELEDEYESEEDEAGLQHHENVHTKENGPIEIIDLDSDESEGETTGRGNNIGNTTDNFDPYSRSQDNRAGLGGYTREDEEGDEDSEEERAEIEDDIDEEVSGDEDEGVYGKGLEDDGEVGDDDEAAYDEEMESDYESGNENRREYGDYGDYDAELDPEGFSDEEEQQPPPPQAAPEVIVLDSDSDDEPQPSSRSEPAEHPLQNAVHLREQQESDQTGLPSEDSISSKHSMESEVEGSDYYEGEQSAGDEYTDEQSEYDQEEGEDENARLDEFVALSSSAWAADIENERPTVVDEDIDQLTVPVQESGHSAHEQKVTIERPVQQSDISPEPPRDVDFAQDPNLIQPSMTPKEGTPEGAGEQKLDHVEIRNTQPGGSPGAPDQAGVSSNPIWLDGATDVAPVSGIEVFNPLSAIQGHPITPRDSQGIQISRRDSTNAELDGALPGALPTPQYSQEVFLESAVQEAIAESTSPTDPVPAISYFDSGPLAVEELVEVGKDPFSENIEDQHPGHDASPTPGRYFSPAGPNPNLDTLDLHSVFAPLATLADHVDALTDTISAVCEVSATPMEHILTVQLTDPSMAGYSLPAQISLDDHTPPKIAEGDALLLRNFKVQSHDHVLTLTTVDTSSWTIFNDSTPTIQDTESSAPAIDIRKWYQDVGSAMIADNQLQASIIMASKEATPSSGAAISDDESMDSATPDANEDSPSASRIGIGRRRRRHHRKITVHELRDGRRYTQVGSPSDRESIHQLRDGTVYANL